jgi:hypothetical protein
MLQRKNKILTHAVKDEEERMAADEGSVLIVFSPAESG